MVTVSAVVGTRSKIMKFDAPVMSSVNLNSPSSGLKAVTVTGLHFGSLDYTARRSVDLAVPSNILVNTFEN